MFCLMKLYITSRKGFKSISFMSDIKKIHPCAPKGEPRKETIIRKKKENTVWFGF